MSTAEHGAPSGAPLGVYVHFPWCVRKCPYCDFNSHPLKGELDERRYLDALLDDFASQRQAISGRVISSVFFGGGTPSLFSPAIFESLLEAFSAQLAVDAEITMEANPGTTGHHDLGDYRSAGINRLSLGAQSFDPAMLAALGRIHGPEDTIRSVAAARQAGFDNINLDLMYGLPNQTRDGALNDLKQAQALAPEHLSWYQLTLEPKTEFARRPPPLPGDLILEAIERSGQALLDTGGYRRYEVSAYARDGRRSRHNLNYWTFGDYLGLGAGAHGKLSAPGSIVRTTKPHQPRIFLARPVETTRRELDTTELAGEFMLGALRLVDGVPLDRFVEATALEPSALEPARRRQIDAGLLQQERLAATPRGYQLLDSLIQDYL